MMNHYQDLIAAIKAGGWGERLQRDMPLAPHTSYCIGGPADLLLEARSQDEMVAWVRLARQMDTPVMVLGSATNVLISDAGVRGLVILNRVVGYEREGERVLVQSGTVLRKLARWATREGLGGLEWAVGVPGTIGGALVGNAGAYGGCMADIVRRVQVLLFDGAVVWWDVAEMAYGYRTSRIKTCSERSRRPIVLAAELQLAPMDADELARVAAGYNEQRRQRTPNGQCAGSVFKRTLQFPAGFLIDQAGLKGLRKGDAVVSELHANFIMNCGSATAADVQGLIQQVQSTIWDHFAQRLEIEIEFIGAWPQTQAGDDASHGGRDER